MIKRNLKPLFMINGFGIKSADKKMLRGDALQQVDR
jgi:hypothetical protein